MAIKKRNIDEESLLRDFGVWLKYDLVGGAENAFCLAVQNPYTRDLIITEVIFRNTTGGGTASAVVDIDVVANATSTGDDIFDGIDIASSTTGMYSSNNATDNGTNGEGRPQVWNAAGGTNDYLTGKILAAAGSNLVGKVYVHVIEAQ